MPNFQDLGKLLIGENPLEMLKCDLKLEHEAIPPLRDAIAYCEEVKDYVSREVFLHIQENEGEHLDWLETRLELIEQIGIQNYFSIANATSVTDQSSY